MSVLNSVTSGELVCGPSGSRDLSVIQERKLFTYWTNLTLRLLLWRLHPSQGAQGDEVPMSLQKGRLQMYFIPHAFLQGHFENSKGMNRSIFFFLNLLNRSASLWLLRRGALSFFPDTRWSIPVG